MKDSYLDFSHSKFGKSLFSVFGLTIPPKLARYKSGDSLIKSSIVLSREKHLAVIQACFVDSDVSVVSKSSTNVHSKPQALIFDATDISSPQQLVQCYEFFHQQLGNLASNGRIVVLGRVIKFDMSIEEAAAQRALWESLNPLPRKLGERGVLQT